MLVKRQSVIAVLTSSVLAACGGGAGGDPSVTTPGAAAPGTAAQNGAAASSPVADPVASAVSGAASAVSGAASAVTGAASSVTAAASAAAPASSAASAVAPVTITISTQPQSQALTVGGNAAFSVVATASSGAAVTYQWQRDGQAITGATSSSYQLASVKATDTGAKFSVQVTIGSVSQSSASAVLTVNAAPTASYPIMFVTSVPGQGFQHQLNTFSNHGTGREDAIAGGDLYVRYPDGTLRNLTKEAGWGVASGGVQGGAKAISVRQPTMHWDGKKALFSMLVGGPTMRYELPNRKWQIYEVTGLGQGETVAITKVANQPNYNNISPIYGSDDNILFISDAPLFGMATVYPQLDEYESAYTNTGIWKLTVATGKVTQLQHAPSGVFDLFLDSFGRILFTKWDHLTRDQQADGDRFFGGVAGSVDYATETSTTPFKSPQTDANGKLIADARGVLYEQFPGARVNQDPTKIANESLQGYNQFFIWQVNQDGTNEETINHVGRHEMLGSYQGPTFNDDPNLSDSLGLSNILNAVMRGTTRGDAGYFQLREDINNPGVYMGTYSAEFARQASGRIMEFKMPPGMNPEALQVKDYTNATLDADPYGAAAALATMTGHYRSPLRLSTGEILVSHTPNYMVNGGGGSTYKFQLKLLKKNPFGTDMIAGASLTGGIVKDIRYWTDLATPVQYVGPLNEHDAIEIRPRPRPAVATSPTPDIEKQVLADEGVNEAELKAWLQSKGLALIVSRNVTMRDRADVTQPYNLQVKQANGTVGASNIVKSGKVYDINALQIFQGDLTRGYGNGQKAGRRVYTRPVHNNAQTPTIEQWYNTTPTNGATILGSDGSMAAFVPAGRALTWQLVSPAGKPVVREKVWVNFAAGEIRVCASCHGLNKQTANGLAEPVNPPNALRDLVRLWKTKK